MFNASRFRKSGGGGMRSGKPDIFKPGGGKLYKARFQRRVGRLPLSRMQKEYVKQVMAKYDRPGSKGITRGEFMAGLDEMAKNTNDNIRQQEIKRIKEHF